MESASSVGRVTGVLLLAQAVCGLLSLVLLKPALAAPGFLVNAAPHSLQISLAVMLGLAAGALSVAVAIAAWPVFRQYGRATAMWILALAVAGLALAAVENMTLLSMLSLSQAFAKATTADAGQFEALGTVVRSTRYWAHYMKLIVGVGMFLVFFGALFRFALIPRVLAGFALLATLLQLFAVTMPVFGHRIVFQLLAPAGLAFLTIALWLIVRGFSDPPRRSHSDSPQAGDAA